MTTPLVLVVDTGVDDALALAVAVRHPAVRLQAVVATAGTVPLARALANTLWVLRELGADVPVGLGGATTLDGSTFPPRPGHGPDGIAGLGPSADAALAGRPAAVDLLASHEAARVVCLGPLTCLAGVGRGVLASFAAPGEANDAMDPAATARLRGEGLLEADAPPPPDPPPRLAGLPGRLAAHQRRRGAGIGDAATVLRLAGSRDLIGDLALLLG